MKKILVLIVVLLVSVAAAQNCGLNSGEAATGEPINVGSIVGETGPEDFSSASKAAKAYFDCVNANGGINGRPVNYLVEDDAWNPEQASQAAAKLINDRDVVAMVGNTSFVECGINAPIYNEADVIVLTSVGVPRECFENRNIVPINQGPRLSTIGAAQYAFDTYESKSFVCMGTNIPNVNTWSCNGVIEWGKGVGATVETILFDPAALDPTSLILEATIYRPDAILLSLPAGIAIAVLGAAEEQDLRDRFKWLGPTAIYDLAFPEAIGPYWDGAIDAQIELADISSEGEDNQNWLSIVDAYGNDSDPRDSFSQAGFLAAKIFTDTVLELEPDDLSRENVTAALRGVTNYSSDLLCSPWYVGPGDRHNANHKGRIARVQDGAWELSAGCFEVDDPDLEDVLSLEAEGGLVD